jgi:GT2 family glycosyltransferase
MNRTGAFILTYNRKDLLGECLDTVLGQSEPPDEVVVLDNGSTDGTREELAARRWPEGVRVAIYALPRNVGPAGGYDALFRIGFARGVDFLWFMDDDVIPDADALAALMEALRANFREPGEVAFLQSVAVARDGTPANVPEIDLRAAPHQCPNWAERLDRGLVRLRWATLNSILVPRTTPLRVGGLSADFHFGGEDIDFTLRATEVLPGYLVGRSRVRHLRAATGVFSAVTQPPDPARIRLARYYYRNNVYLRRRYYGTQRVILYLARCAVEGLAALGARKLKLARVMSIWGGAVAGLFFTPRFRPLTEPPNPSPTEPALPAAAAAVPNRAMELASHRPHA